MDEHTPHIHATVVPIVTGERRKAKKKQPDDKCTYRKKSNAVRLCADDLLTREGLSPTTTATLQRWRNTACSVVSGVQKHGTRPPPNTTVT